MSPDNNLYYSSVSIVEVDLKTKSKNNNLEFTTEQFTQKCRGAGYIPLPFKESHLLRANKLIWDGEGDEHRDPFDRVLLAQAMVEEMYFITHDDLIPKFKQNCVIVV